MTEIRFRVDGEPKPQPRQRSAVVRGRGGRPVLGKNGDPIVRAFDPGTAEGWKGHVAIVARPLRPAVPWVGPIALELDLDLPRPQSLRRARDPAGRIPHHTGMRGDVDNYAKAVLDILTALGFWLDDAQVFDLWVRKYWAPKDGRPGADICIRDCSAELRVAEPAELFPSAAGGSS